MVTIIQRETQGGANGNSVRGRLEYNIANGLTSGINIAYDPAFSEGYSSGEFYKTLNLSVDLKWRFGANGYGAPSIRKQQPVVTPVIQALSASPDNRDVRVHDCSFTSFWSGGCNRRMEQAFAPVAEPFVEAYNKVADFVAPIFDNPNRTMSDPTPCTGWTDNWGQCYSNHTIGYHVTASGGQRIFVPRPGCDYWLDGRGRGRCGGRDQP